MTTETALTLSETMSLGTVLAKSGYFSDARGEAQAVVKVLAGREMGFGPIASMTGVHIVQGKPTIGANLLAAAVKRSGRYDYRVLTLTDERCEIAFLEHGQEIGRSAFTMDDAKKAELIGNPTWKKYPKNMLFSRTMSNGTRWYCPDILAGVIPYTPEELGADVDGDGNVIDVTPTPMPEPEPERRAEPAPDTGGSGAIKTPTQLLEAIKPLGYYRDGKHALNTYNKQTSEALGTWPANDAAFYNRALGILTEYAQAQKAQQVISETASQMAIPA